MVAILYGLICLIWGSTWLGIKIGLEGVPPFLGAGLRFMLSTAILAVLVKLRGRPIALTRADKISVWSCGIYSFTLSYAFVYWAEQHISSGLTAILFCTMPLFVALLGHYWTKTERMGARKMAGIFIGIAGTTVLFWPQQRISRSETLGMISALLASLTAAMNLVTTKKYSKHTDIYVLNAAGMAIGTICLLGLSLLTESYENLIWTEPNVIALLYLAVFGSVVAFLAYYHLVKVMEASILSLITLIFPLVAVALGWIILGERTSAGGWAGIITVLLGVAVALGPPGRKFP